MPTPRASAARRIGFGVVAAIATLLTLFLTIGSIGQLLSAELSDGERLAFLTHVPWLGLGWCAGFAVMIRGAARRPAAMQQSLAMLACLYLGGMVITREDDPVFYVGFGVVLTLLLLLHPTRSAVFRPGPAGVSPRLVVLSLVAAGPLLTYAVRLGELMRSTGDEAPFYTGIAVTAVAVPLLGLAAGLRAPAFRLPGWSATLMLGSIGVGSLLYDDRGALGTAGAIVAVAGAVLFGVVVERDARATSSARPVTAGVHPASTAAP